jgi:hypothetical protein
MSHRFWSVVVPLFATFTAGCSSSSDGAKEPTNEAYLGLKAPAHGFQVRSEGKTIPAGGDEEYCEIAELPGGEDDVYYTEAIELANGEGSHHLIVQVARPGSQADQKMRALPIGHRVPCVAAEMAFGDGLEMVSGIQTPYGKVDYAPGISQRYYGGQRVVFDYHYYNTTEAPIDARSAVNFHLRDRADVEQLQGSFTVMNWLIDTPPGGNKAFKAEVRLERDLMVGGLSRHTHQWGGDFHAWFAGGSRDGEHIFTSKDYESDTYHDFDEPVLVKAGEGFSFECSFHNDQARPLRFGTAASDEMCILSGPVWDPSGEFEGPDVLFDIAWEDAGGVGHPAAFEGAFPTPPAADVALCQAGLGESKDACAACVCESCATIAVKCFTDADCAPIAQCAAPTDCAPVIDEHSSGVGLSRQIGECVISRCAAACGAG